MSTLAEHSVSPAARAVPHQPRHIAGRTAAPRRTCIACSAGDLERVLDLGAAPLVLGETLADDTPMTAPLRLARCRGCAVLQLEDTRSRQARDLIATAASLRTFAGRPDCARRFCEQAIDRWRLRGEGHVIEIGSATGSLLRFFHAWQLPVLGIEPDPQLSRYARMRRIPTWRAMFDAEVAERISRAGMHADLVIMSTPIGACDDLPALLAALSTVLRPGGVVALDMPDALRVVGRTRIDGLRHSDPLLASIDQLQHMLAVHDLDLVDVERTAETVGERLRVWACRRQDGAGPEPHPRVRTRLRAERANAIDDRAAVSAFAGRVDLVHRQIRGLLDDARSAHRSVALWGTSPVAVAIAAAAGIDRRHADFAVETDACSTRMVLHGTGIPVLASADVADRRPDLVLALDDLRHQPPGWEGVPVYAVDDLIDVVHRVRG
ncbi:MAG TPA: methyltransferase domain-containing protein [Euzebyales bacterium]|nr:methyltransferase domain-containing protein [Euzebyales bacterium]